MFCGNVIVQTIAEPTKLPALIPRVRYLTADRNASVNESRLTFKVRDPVWVKENSSAASHRDGGSISQSSMLCTSRNRDAASALLRPETVGKSANNLQLA